jgi:hypothetical protein
MDEVERALECDAVGHDLEVHELHLGFSGAQMASTCRRCGGLIYEGSGSERDERAGRRPRLWTD